MGRRVARGSGVYVPEFDLKADPHVSILKHLRFVRAETNFQGERQRKADLIHSSYLCPGKLLINTDILFSKWGYKPQEDSTALTLKSD